MNRNEIPSEPETADPITEDPVVKTGLEAEQEVSPDAEKAASLVLREADLVEQIPEGQAEKGHKSGKLQRWMSGIFLATSVAACMGMSANAEGGSRRRSGGDWHEQQLKRQIGWQIKQMREQGAHFKRMELQQRLSIHMQEMQRARFEYQQTNVEYDSKMQWAHRNNDTKEVERLRQEGHAKLEEIEDRGRFHEEEARKAERELRSFEFKDGLKRDAVGAVVDILTGR